ncbi:MAG: YraN family protein, partial [Anaerolineales bacterium]
MAKDVKGHNQYIGRWGEQYAEAYFAERGWIVLDRNVHTPYGELDLVIKQGDVLVFVEVKTRTTDSFGLPEMAVSSLKQTRLVQSAEYYLQS